MTLKLDPRNARKHPDRNKAAIRASLEEVGPFRSIAIDGEDIVRAGNGVYEQAQALGLKVRVVEAGADELIAVKRADLVGEKAVRAAVLDNRAGDLSEFDPGVLKWLQENQPRTVDGLWTAEEWRELVGRDGKEKEDPGGDVDHAAELLEKWKVKTGDLWEIGAHRLICGDCTDRAVVERVMGGEKAQVLFTSPPYWVGFEYEYENKWSEVIDFISRFSALHVDFVNADGRIIVNTGTVQAGELTGQKAHMKLLADTWTNAFEGLGWLMRYVRFWVKDGGLLHTAPQVDCIDQHTEFICYFYNPKGKFRGQERTGEPWAGKGYWDDIPGAARQSGHMAAFPVELPERNLTLFSRPDEIVSEPFSGSGTTLIACERLARKCRAVEISPAYCAVALERWADMTGLTPKLSS